jgi:GH15 family glucan-1,4-alpha-glucosidase
MKPSPGSTNGRYEPIESYAVIGDQRTAALVSRDGSIDWTCLPRFDSPSVFARLLDVDAGGYWRAGPVGPASSSRAYLPGTNVIRTEYQTDSGSVSVTDFMPIATVGDTRSETHIVRLVRGVAGSVRIESVLDPRPDYGRSGARVAANGEGSWRVADGAAELTVHCSAKTIAEDGPRNSSATIFTGDAIAFVLSYGHAAPVRQSQDLISWALEAESTTIDAWRDWSGRMTYQGPYEANVLRSALTLQLLKYAPTGATVAAATTSLPEEIGGERNWDYRYTWLRDTAFTYYALNSVGYPEEGARFVDWVTVLAGGEPRNLAVLYAIDGSEEAPEEVLGHLEGHRASSPVRIGNAAQTQLQLDIYGELLDCAYTVSRNTGRINPDVWPFLERTVDFVCDHWTEPDQGIWEVRSGPRHFVYSKALCWVAIDRGIRLASAWGLPGDHSRWERVRDEIYEWLLLYGLDEQTGAFTQAAGHPGIDAALLSLPLRKVMPANAPQMRATIDLIAEALNKDGLLRRVSEEFADGVPGGEGAFLLCSFWLADCYIYIGRVEEATELFERLLSYANDLGLLSEEYDPVAGHQLGNFPQAFTHVALINTAVNLARARASEPA